MSEKLRERRRIEPVYRMPDEGHEIVVVEDTAAKLKQNKHEFDGRLRIVLDLSESRLAWEFLGSGLKSVDMGYVTLTADGVDERIRVHSRSDQLARGVIVSPLQVGNAEEIDHVIFHVPNCPWLNAETRAYRKDAQTRGTVRHVELNADGWTICLQPVGDPKELKRQAGEAEIFLNAVGEIRRADGQPFAGKKVVPILDCLRLFLSFAFAKWMPPMLPVGRTADGTEQWHYLANFAVSAGKWSRGWIGKIEARHLSSAFAGFHELWSRPEWQEPLEVAISWLIEATAQSGGVEGAIAFAQIPLEMLAWMVFADQGDGRPEEIDKNFENLDAWEKIEELLRNADIPVDVPQELTNLVKLSHEFDPRPSKKKSKKDRNGCEHEHESGPGIITRVRNKIIHPTKKNREAVSNWERDYQVAAADIRWETLQLFRWYIMLVLLNLTGYRGQYRNPLNPRLDADEETVPWATGASRESGGSDTDALGEPTDASN